MSPAQPGLRILFHHRVAASDGMRVHIRQLVGALRAAGHVVKVVGPSADDGQAQAGARTRLEAVADRLRRHLPPALFEALELLYNAPAYWRLKRAAEAFQPDILYERYNLFLLAGLLLKRRMGLPMLLEINSPLAAERAGCGQLRLKSVGGLCQAALWRGADVALPVTHVLARDVRRSRPAGPIEVIPNGAELEPPPATTPESIRSRLGLAADALLLGFVGFIRDWHGVGWAVEALPELPARAHLVVIGDGPAAADLRARAEALGVADRLHLMGRVQHDEVAGYVRAFDVALQTASVAYASPLKLFEYMAHERAVIAPDQPNIREVLTDGHDGLLFQPGDKTAFVGALRALCMDEMLRARLGRAAGRTVRDRPFTWTHNAERIAQLARAEISAAGARASSVPSSSATAVGASL